MNWIRNLKIGPRLLAGFGAVLTLLALIGVIGVIEIKRVNFNANELGTNWLPSVRALGNITAELNEVRRVSLRILLEAEAGQRDEQIHRHDSARQEGVPKAFRAYEQLISSAEEQQLWKDVQRDWEAYLAFDAKVIALAQSGDPAAKAQASALAIGEAGAAFLKTQASLEKSVQLNEQGAAGATAQSARDYEMALTLISIGEAIALSLGLIIALAIARSIKEPINRALKVAQTVAEGDLTQKITASGKDEPADLLRALGHMNDRLVDIVGQVRLSSDSIATGSAEIAMGNADLSQRTEQQASNLEETAASMEELNSTVKTNADTAQQANRLASEATHAAEEGGAVVGRVVATMQDISESSKKISDIISVIDGIAFQTNILALNAAVEAARAGEQGRGFAVVASEVRSLASRSAEAAKEIKSLINASVEKVDSGTALVDEAGHSMEGIVSQVKRVSALINEISNASMEQSSGISQVGDAVNQLDQVTQQNAALVEESAAAADSLKAQSQRLAELVAVFKIDAQPNNFQSGTHISSPGLKRPGTKVPMAKKAPPKSAPQIKAPAKPALTHAATAAENADWETF